MENKGDAYFGSRERYESDKFGLKIHNLFCTVGQSNYIIIYEADEKEAVKIGVAWSEFCETQTMVAIPSEEAQKLLK